MNIVTFWEAAKEFLASGSGLTHHELHLIAGVLLYLALGLVLRRPLSSFLPLLPVAFLEGFNEWSDYQWFVKNRWDWHWQDAAVDVALTIGLPIAVVLRAKWDSRFKQEVDANALGAAKEGVVAAPGGSTGPTIEE